MIQNILGIIRQLILLCVISVPKGNSEFAKKVRCLQDMGVGEHQALVALSSCNWDVDRAIEQLFS